MTLYILGCLFLPSTKFYFGWSVLLIVIVFILNKSWEKTVFLTYWPLKIYYVGQLYVFRVIEPEELNHPLYPDGRSLYFKLTPVMILAVSMIVSWIIQIVKQRKIINHPIIVCWLFLVLSRYISAVSMAVKPQWVETFNFIDNLGLLVWCWWGMNFLKKQNRLMKIYYWKYLAWVLKLAIIIGSVLVIIQGFRGSGLGTIVEQSKSLPFYGSSSDEETWLNRPMGLWTHANLAAFYILAQLSAWILIQVKLGLKMKEWFRKWILIPLLAIVWLQSRSTFLGLIPISIWWYLVYRTEIKKAVNKTINYGIQFAFILVIMFLSAITVGDRFWNTVTNLGNNSGFVMRHNLVLVAGQVINHHFWSGVGEDNFIPIAFREDISNTVKLFPESVHNGWILLMAEQGLIGVTLWGIFLGTLAIFWWKFTRNNKKMRWLLFSSLLAQYLAMLFQPFTEILSVNLIMAMLLWGSEDKTI